MQLISWDTAEFHFEAWFLQGARQTGLVCTHAFLPLRARQRVWEGVRLGSHREGPWPGVAKPSLQAACTLHLGQYPQWLQPPRHRLPVFSRQLMSSPALGICLKRPAFRSLTAGACSSSTSGLSATLESEAARTNYKHSLTSFHAARLWLIVHNELFLQKDFSLTRSSRPQPESGKLLDEQR